MKGIPKHVCNITRKTFLDIYIKLNLVTSILRLVQATSDSYMYSQPKKNPPELQTWLPERLFSAAAAFGASVKP